jgi:hypothetical protein
MPVASFVELAHHARGLARIVFVQPFSLSSQCLHGPLHATFVDVRHVVCLFAPLGNSKSRYLAFEVRPGAARTARTRLRVHAAGEKVKDHVAIRTIKFVNWHASPSQRKTRFQKAAVRRPLP